MVDRKRVEEDSEAFALLAINAHLHLTLLYFDDDEGAVQSKVLEHASIPS